MKGKLPLFLTVLLAALFCASLAMAQPPATGHRISYSGMCAYEPLSQTVSVDTIFVLSNPNRVQVNNVAITIYDKYGNEIIHDTMLDGGNPRTYIPPNGWNYQTIGKLFKKWGAEPGPAMTKYDILITWDKPDVSQFPPYRFMMCEVKQIVYETPQDPDAIWSNFSNIKDWSETALGGKITTGTYKR